MHVDYPDTCSSTLFDTVAVYLAYRTELLDLAPLRLRISENSQTLPGSSSNPIQAALRWRNPEKFLDHLVARLSP